MSPRRITAVDNATPELVGTNQEQIDRADSAARSEGQSRDNDPVKRQRRRGYKVMSRRCQNASEIVVGGFYRVRVRVDNEDGTRTQKSIAICPVSGPGSLNRRERERKRQEILSRYNSSGYLTKIIDTFDGLTFEQQSKTFIAGCRKMITKNIMINGVKTKLQKQKIKEVTVRTWEGFVLNHLNPFLGKRPLKQVGNGAMEELIDHLNNETGLSPSSIRSICNVVKLIRASAVNEDKEELYAYQWKPLVELGAPEVNKREQRTPTFTREEIETMLQNSTGMLQVMVALFGATGPRKSECLGLEVAHYDGHSILIEQSITITSTPDDELKTEYAPRRVELHPHICAWLDKYLNGRTTGYIFQNRKGKPLSYSNLLKRYFHPLLLKCGIEKQGLHGFRRYRDTYLRNRTNCPEGVYKFWLGHSTGGDMSEHYDKVGSDKETQFRRDVAASAGYGFTLPEQYCESIVPRKAICSKQSKVAVAVEVL
jgi:integrase